MEYCFSVNKFSCKKQPLEETMTWVRIVSIVVVDSPSHAWLCDPMDCSLLGSSVMGLSRQEYWSGLPFPSPGDLPGPGIEPGSPVLQADSLLTELRGQRPWALREAMREVSLNVHCSNSEMLGQVWQLQGETLTVIWINICMRVWEPEVGEECKVFLSGTRFLVPWPVLDPNDGNGNIWSCF